MTLPSISPEMIEFDLFITALSFLLGFVVNKRFKLLVQVILLIIRMAKWYHETHPEGKKKAEQYKFDEQMTQLYEKHLMTYDKNLKASRDTGAEG